jgi:hypothetical protein
MKKNPCENRRPCCEAEKQGGSEDSQGKYTCEGYGYPPFHVFKFRFRGFERLHTGFTAEIIFPPSNYPFYGAVFWDYHTAYRVFGHFSCHRSCLFSRDLQIRLRLFVKILFTGQRAKIIGSAFVQRGSYGGFVFYGHFTYRVNNFHFFSVKYLSSIFVYTNNALMRQQFRKALFREACN